MSKVTEHSKIGFFEILCFIIIVISFVSVTLLVLHKFNPRVALGLSLMAFLPFLIMYRKSISIKLFTKANLVLLGILLLTLVFRSQPYFHVGLWDSATYMAMSESFANTGSPLIYDSVLLKINDTSVLKVYDGNNYFSGKEFNANTGIQYRAKGVYEFRFPPIYPLWMSLFSVFLNGENRLYALTFFSLLSIAVFFLIGLELFNGKILTGAIIGVLLAVNPLHAFFSKQTYSEITAIFFLFSGLYFLLKYYNTYRNSQSPNAIHLFLSAALIGCFFFTRITGFFYIPFFCILAALICLYFPTGRTKTKLLVYFLSIAFFYSLSILYAYKYTNKYFHDILKDLILSKYIGTSTILFALGFSFIAFLYLLNFIQKKNYAWANKVKDWFKRIGGIFLVVAFCGMILYNVYISKLLDTFIYAQYPELFFSKGVLFHLILYVSLPLFILSFPAIYIFSKKDVRFFSICLLLVLILPIFLREATMPTVIYNQKYLLESLVPLFLLLSSCLLGEMLMRDKFSKVLAVVILLLVVPVAFYQSALQLEGRAGEGAYESLLHIKEQVSDDDLLIIERRYDVVHDLPRFWPTKLLLDFFYGVKTFAVRQVADINTKEFSDYFGNYGDVYILTQVEINQTLKLDTELVSKINYVHGDVGEQRIPRGFNLWNMDLFLYKITPKN